MSSGEQQKCSDMGAAFQNKGLTPAIKCIYGDSVTDCMKKIKVTDVSSCQTATVMFIHLKFKGQHESLMENGFFEAALTSDLTKRNKKDSLFMLRKQEGRLLLSVQTSR